MRVFVRVYMYVCMCMYMCACARVCKCVWIVVEDNDLIKNSRIALRGNGDGYRKIEPSRNNFTPEQKEIS